MKNKIKLLAVISAMVMALTAFGCKTDTEWKDKTYCSAVTFTSKATEDGVKVTMETSTEGAAIYYTTDGTAPTAESTKYSKPVEFTTDVTVKAIAVKTGIENSPVSVATISIKEKKIVEIKTEYVDKIYCSAVTFTSQATENSVKVTMATATKEAVIYYTTDGKEPTAESTKYSEAVEFTKDATVKAIAIKTGIENSPVSVATVSIKEKTVESAGEPLKIELKASVPQENGYTGNKSNTKVTVTANITTASSVKKVVWKKRGSINAKILLADEDAAEATVSDDNAVWTFDITATDESANGTYTVAAIDEAGREEAEQITIDNFDFTPPGNVKVTNAVYSSELSPIIINWTEPGDADYHHVDITYTTNDGTSDSEPSQAITVNKGTLNNTFSGIDGAKAYYTYTFVTYDELGNKSGEYRRKVYVNAVRNCPEGFVEVTGTTITGKEEWTPTSDVFVSERSITIPDMYVCDHEVTQAEYEKYCKYGSSSPSSRYGDGDNYPAYDVNWYDAIVYCNLRSIDECLTPAYKIGEETDPAKWSGIVGNATNGYCGPSSRNSTWDELTYDKEADGYRLPTEAEWEWLARGGENYTYAGSNTVGDVAWYITNTNDTGSREVKTKKANGYGLYDMSGNVYEWCYDWNGTVSSSTADTGASSGSARVRRGGSWNDDGASYCAVSNRNNYYPFIRYFNCGFRVVRSAN